MGKSRPLAMEAERKTQTGQRKVMWMWIGMGHCFVENSVPDENKDALIRLQREDYRVHSSSASVATRGGRM